MLAYIMARIIAMSHSKRCEVRFSTFDEICALVCGGAKPHKTTDASDGTRGSGSSSDRECCSDRTSRGITLSPTSAIDRTTGGFNLLPSLSSDGRLLYNVYEINVTSPTDLAAELFVNINGNLQTLAVTNGDLAFPSVDSGHASHDFLLYSLLDDTGPSSANTGVARVRLFDSRLQLVRQVTFDDIRPAGYPFYGGTFSSDNRYLAVSYIIGYDGVVGATVPTAHPLTLIRVLAVSDLSTVLSTTFNGASDQGPSFFRVCGKEYLITDSFQGFYDATDPVAEWPASLNIYRVKSIQLEPSEQIFFPQLPRYSVRGSGCASQEVAILVGTNRATPLGTVSPYFDALQPARTSLIRGDSNSFYIYVKGRGKTQLKAKETIEMDVWAPLLLDRLGVVLVPTIYRDQQGTSLPGVASSRGSSEYVAPLVVPPRPSLVTDAAQDWIVVAGTDQSLAVGIHNLVLYSVSSC